MFETVIAAFLILWLLGVVTSFTMGGFIHIFLVIAMTMIVVRIFRDRTPGVGF
jgi:hypothetical protein